MKKLIKEKKFCIKKKCHQIQKTLTKAYVTEIKEFYANKKES